MILIILVFTNKIIVVVMSLILLKLIRHFKIRYKEHIFEMRLKKMYHISNFAKHVLGNNHNITLSIDKVLEILNIQHTTRIYKNYVLKELCHIFSKEK